MKQLWLGMLFILAATALAHAGTTGVLSGFVFDKHGKAVAHARVRVVSASGYAHTETSDRGFYTFLQLPPDVYTLDVDEGLGAYANGVRINSDQTTSVNVRLIGFHCSAYVRTSIGNDQRSEQFTSLDLRGTGSPPHTLLPMLPITQPSGYFRCL